MDEKLSHQPSCDEFVPRDVRRLFERLHLVLVTSSRLGGFPSAFTTQVKHTITPCSFAVLTSSSQKLLPSSSGIQATEGVNIWIFRFHYLIRCSSILNRSFPKTDDSRIIAGFRSSLIVKVHMNVSQTQRPWFHLRSTYCPNANTKSGQILTIWQSERPNLLRWSDLPACDCHASFPGHVTISMMTGR